MKALLALALFFSASSALALGSVDRSAVKAEWQSLRNQGFIGNGGDCDTESSTFDQVTPSNPVYQSVMLCQNKEGQKVRIRETTEVTGDLYSKCRDERVTALEIQKL